MTNWRDQDRLTPANDAPGHADLTETVMGVPLAAIVARPRRLSVVSAWLEHIPFAFWIMHALRPARVVELGTHTGVSFSAFCQGAETAGVDATLIAVDTWEGDSQTLASPMAYGGDVYADLRGYLEAEFPRTSQMWRMTFDEALARVPDGSVDLLHIDGLHTYEAVRHDFETWRTKLSPRGVVLFHDIAVRTGDFGVWRFWEDVSRDRPSFAFSHCNGLGVLAVGADCGATVDWLTNLEGDRADGVRDLFHRLGRVWSAESDLAIAAERVDQFRAGEARQLESAQAAHAAIGVRDAALHEARAEAAALKERLRAADEREQALRTSTSWRITAPLRLGVRAAGSLLKVLRQGETRTFGLTEASPAVYRIAGLDGGAPSRWARFKIDGQVRVRVVGGPESGRAYALRNTRLLRLPDHFDALDVEVDDDFSPDTIKAIFLTRPRALAEIVAANPASAGAFLAKLRTAGLRPALEVISADRRAVRSDDYATWIARYDTMTDADRAALQSKLDARANTPKISVVVPVYNTPLRYLDEMIESVLQQIYPHWELCIADDASPQAHVWPALQAWAAKDMRIKVVRREVNGNISAASNSALALATGDFVALLDHDDILPAHALALVALATSDTPTADIFYSDEDKIDADGKRFDPYFKTDWNPELLLAQNYVSHLGVYRRTLLDRVGGFRLGFEGSQDHDLILRCARATTGPIVHIPHVLYHWRLFEGAGTFSSTRAEEAAASARRAITEHLAASGEIAEVTSAGLGGYHLVRRAEPAVWPKVSVIVPTRDGLAMLERCIDGLLRETDYTDLDIIIADNDSAEATTLAWFDALCARDARVRIVKTPGPFNFSRINNLAAAQASGDMLLFLNNDVSMIAPGWLKEMVQLALLPSVGGVGARLLYPDNTVQHAGVVLGMGGVAGHVHRGASKDDPGYFARLKLRQDIGCLTAACMVMRREVFTQTGGFDEDNLAVAFNDVDLCLRIRALGYRLLWTPFAELHHWESKSRGSDLAPDKIERFRREVAYMERRWSKELAADPYFNPNLALNNTTPALAFPPRRPLIPG